MISRKRQTYRNVPVRGDNKMKHYPLTLTVLVTTIDALQHFETG